MTLIDFTTRILIAVILGFVIGFERQLTGHVAGIRINVLVCLGTSMFVLFSIIMETGDVTRIAAQIVTGVGFLCSGIIFKDGIQVRGLNTAATIWCTAAIGVLTCSGNYLFAVIATLLLLITNIIFRPVAIILRPLERFDETENYYKISVVCPEDVELQIRSLIMNQLLHTKLTLVTLESADVLGDKVEIEATIKCSGRKQDNAAEKLIAKVSLEQGVSKVGWEAV